MRIQNTTPLYQNLTQTRRTNSRNSFFSQQLDIAASRNQDQCSFSAPASSGPRYLPMQLSAYCTLMNSYRAWTAEQPPQQLPDSQGLTEENIAYLRERYSGELSWEERVDVLETMEKMGIIDKEQKYEAMGSKKIVTHMIEMPDGSLRPEKEPEVDLMDEDSFSSDLNIFYRKYPFSKFTNVENIFAWLATLPSGET